VKPAMKLKS